MGAFSDWAQKPEFKLSYKYTSKMYTARILLKQGIYNYLYEICDTQTQKTERSTLEGSHFNAENDYTLLFYYRAYTNDFDELLGYQRINSLGR